MTWPCSASSSRIVLRLEWPDIDFKKKSVALNRGLVAVGYELHQTRGTTRNARRNIDLDDTTLTVLEGWRAFQAAEFAAVGIDNDEGWVFTDGDGNPIHPHALYQSFRRIVANADIPPLRFHGLRHTHGSLLIKEGTASIDASSSTWLRCRGQFTGPDEVLQFDFCNLDEVAAARGGAREGHRP